MLTANNWLDGAARVWPAGEIPLWNYRVPAVVFRTVVLLLSGANDIIAFVFDVSLNAAIWWGRLGLVLLPPLAYYLTYRICLGLQRRDRETLEHGIETGIGRNGLPYAGAPVPKKPNELGAAGKPIPRGFFSPDPQSTDERR